MGAKKADIILMESESKELYLDTFRTVKIFLKYFVQVQPLRLIFLPKYVHLVRTIHGAEAHTQSLAENK